MLNFKYDVCTRQCPYKVQVNGMYQGELSIKKGNDSNLLIVLYVQIMPDDLVMQLHRF